MARFSLLLPAVAGALLFASSVVAGPTDACHANNCLRGITGRGDAGKAFCSTFLAGPYPSPLPSYVSPCTAGPTQIASACSCAGVTARPTTTSTTAATTNTATSSCPAVNTPVSCPPEVLGPLCVGQGTDTDGAFGELGNDHFGLGHCAWNRIKASAGLGSIVSVSADGAFGAPEKRPGWRWSGFMWTGTEGLSQPWAVCPFDNQCWMGVSVRTTDESCGFQVCFWRDLDDPAQYQCLGGGSPTDWRYASAEDGDWRLHQMPSLGRSYYGQRGWTVSLFVNNCNLYVSRFGNSCGAK